jgi:hypothetical protein
MLGSVHSFLNRCKRSGLKRALSPDLHTKGWKLHLRIGSRTIRFLWLFWLFWLLWLLWLLWLPLTSGKGGEEKKDPEPVN